MARPFFFPFLTLFFAVLFFPKIAQSQSGRGNPEFLPLDSLLNTQISTASKYGQTVREIPASITLVTREEIEEYGFMNLPEILSMVRSLYISDDRHYQYLGVRGFSPPSAYSNRVVLMVDGHVLNEKIWGGGSFGPDLSGMNVRQIERIEIIRGPSSTLYGNHSLLAVINIIMNRGSNVNGLSANISTGSYGHLQAGLLSGFRKGDFEFSLSGQMGKRSGQELYYPEYNTINNGIADRIDGSNHHGLNLKLSYQALTFNFMGTFQKTHVPTGSFGTIFSDPRLITKDIRGFADLTYEKDLGARLHLTVKTYLDRYSYSGAYPYDTADGGLYDEGALAIWAGFEARMHYDFHANNRLLWGTQFQNIFKAQYYAFDETDTYFDQSFPYKTISFFVQDEYEPFDWLSIMLGARFDQLYQNKKALTPKVALNFFITPKLTLKALYGNAFRAPNIFEFNIDDGVSFKPNPNLNPERIRSFELTSEQRISNSFWVSTSIYHNEFQNLVEQIEDSIDGLVQHQNTGNYQGSGMEIGGNARMKNGFKLYANYGLQRILSDELPNGFTNSPLHILKWGGSVPFLKNFRLASDMQYQSSRITVYGTRTSSFLLVNANLSFVPHTSSSLLNRFRLNLRVRNLLNAQYAYPGGLEHQQAAIQQNGINFILRLQAGIF